MSFKHLLEKYKNGNASAEEIRLIEDELDKYEAMEEYLSESYDLDFGKQVSKETIHTENSYVKKGVNRKLRKVIFASVASVFLILFMTFYIVSPIIGTFYYNPSQNTVGKIHKIVGKSNKDVYFDLAAQTELNIPGYSLTSTNTENLGFGKYNVYFERVNWFNHQIKGVNIKIVRNSMEYNLNDLRNYFLISEVEFLDREVPDTDYAKMNKQNNDMINYMKELSPVSYISSYILFRKDLSLEKLDKLIKSYGDKLSFQWVGVRNDAQIKTEILSGPYCLTGFNPDYMKTIISDDSTDKIKYPYLQLGDYLEEAWKQSKPNDSLVEVYTKHYTSLLRYMIDREEAVKALNISQIKLKQYKSALNYVEKNGINVYGILIYGESRDLLEFIKDQNIKKIDIKGVLPSKYID
jgi:hypothetical protein